MGFVLVQPPGGFHVAAMNPTSADPGTKLFKLCAHVPRT